MRLVHLTTIPATLAFLRGQAASLHGMGFDVHAISSPGPDLTRFGEEELVAVHAVEMARRIAPLRDLAALWRVWRLLRKLQPSIVDAHTPKAGLIGMVAGTLAGTPVRIYHLHGLRFATTSGWRRHLLCLLETVSCAFAHRVLAVSPSVRAIAIEERICNPARIKVLLRGSIAGVDAAGRFRPEPGMLRDGRRSTLGIPPNSSVIGFVGRLARDKGLSDLATAWQQLRSNELLRLLVVGSFDSSDPPTSESMNMLRSDPRVHFTGLVPDAAPLYTAMDVVALPTYREGLSQVALEAAAMALPVVAYRVSGCVDSIMDGVTGTLVPSRDVNALVQALRRYVADPALRQEHGTAARSRVLAEFRPDDLFQALASEYADLVAANAPDHRRPPPPMLPPQE
ncbi:MAG TPA: glycosyltransferase family 4 protein [Anaeromyxobacteraceae bacterium]|nr:glycosyltransferase family 4 protein [Anaeromyxobacteraceae bacterium]